MSKVVSGFKSLKLSEQHEAFPQITAAYNAARLVIDLDLNAIAVLS